MRLFISLISLFCIGYYSVVSFYTRKLNSTFILFWLISGVGLAGLAVWWKSFLPIIQIALSIGIGLLTIVFLSVEAVIIFTMCQNVDRIPEYLIVLGAQVRGTRITNSLKRRLDKAYQIWQRYPNVRIIVSGGQGKEEAIPEAVAMEGYLIEKGVCAKQILKESISTSTKENLLFSQKFIDNIESPIAIITNNFHVYRAVLYAKQVGYKEIWGIAAGTNLLLFLNYLVREVIAVIVIQLKKIGNA